MKKILAFSFFVICSIARADVYVLGSSYSNDGHPSALDNRPQWHIDCGKPLQYIFDNPLAPCELASTIWPVALVATQFDHISFQPVKGEGITQQSDIETISFWLALQPTALAVIHATWPRPADWEAEFHDINPDNTLTNYSQRYAYELISNLEVANPGRSFVTDRGNEILDSIYHDIQNHVGPLTDFQQMFRDEAGHMSVYGQYLQHNVLRQAFGQRTGMDYTFPGIPRRIKMYLDGKLRAARVERDGMQLDGPPPTLDFTGGQ